MMRDNGSFANVSQVQTSCKRGIITSVKIEVNGVSDVTYCTVLLRSSWITTINTCYVHASLSRVQRLSAEQPSDRIPASRLAT